MRRYHHAPNEEGGTKRREANENAPDTDADDQAPEEVDVEVDGQPTVHIQHTTSASRSQEKDRS